MDAGVQRKNMVESQVRPSDVTDRRIMRAMLEIPRERFVPVSLRPIAYMDEDLQLVAAAPGKPCRGLMAPRAFARLVQLAEITGSDVVLDVGCATGYSAAVLARLAETVVAIEEDAEMSEAAAKTLADLAVDSVAVVTGALANGYAAEGPYDAIVLEGAVQDIPAALLDQLKDGGRLVAVRSQGAVARAVIVRRIGAKFDEREAFDIGAPPLPGFEQARAFVL